jgi:hypothetical protein
LERRKRPTKTGTSSKITGNSRKKVVWSDGDEGRAAWVPLELVDVVD